MARYRVTQRETRVMVFEVEADDEREAEDIATECDMGAQEFRRDSFDERVHDYVELLDDGEQA